MWLNLLVFCCLTLNTSPWPPHLAPWCWQALGKKSSATWPLTRGRVDDQTSHYLRKLGLFISLMHLSRKYLDEANFKTSRPLLTPYPEKNTGLDCPSCSSSPPTLLKTETQFWFSLGCGGVLKHYSQTKLDKNHLCSQVGWTPSLTTCGSLIQIKSVKL